MHPMTWNDCPEIDDIPSVDQADEECLHEIGKVLKRHNKSDRFGITLLHRHFLLTSNELMVETCDFKTRTLTSRPMSTDAFSDNDYRPTVWRFDGHLPHRCQYCPTHGSQHDGYKDNH